MKTEKGNNFYYRETTIGEEISVKKDKIQHSKKGLSNA